MVRFERRISVASLAELVTGMQAQCLFGTDTAWQSCLQQVVVLLLVNSAMEGFV
jgi:hypothetical protein